MAWRLIVDQCTNGRHPVLVDRADASIRVVSHVFSRRKVSQERGLIVASNGRVPKIRLVRQRDMQHHTYADYLIWSANSGNEVIDGIAYVREPPSPSRLHQEVVVELCRQITNSLEGKRKRICEPG